MSVRYFLGNPPDKIKNWIIANSGHPETRVKYTAESGLSDATFNIVGELTSESIDNIDYVEEVDIGNTVTSIGYGVFDHRNSLKSVTIPNRVTSIGSEAF